MSDSILSQDQRELLIREFTELKKQNVLLQQSLRKQETETAANTEDFLLELLEFADTLEALLEHLEKNPEFNPKSIGRVRRKFLSVLGKRQVFPIELQDNQLDFNLCRVVEREVRTDLPDQTITKTVRQGFRFQDKILRPTEIITSKLS
jgi:molecular chaperone GrpE